MNYQPNLPPGYDDSNYLECPRCGEITKDGELCYECELAKAEDEGERMFEQQYQERGQ